MRTLVISRLLDTKWYSNLQNETEGNPPSLETLSDSDLLALYVRHRY